MDYYFITGTSRGIGKALSDLLLTKENTKVFGISRTKTIENSNYSHIKMDLSDFSAIEKFKFPNLENAKEIYLINNSGILGPVKQTGRLNNGDILKTFMVNSIAPAILMNSFIKNYADYSVKKIILNISSGAGRHVIESWATYCSSKAALDMFSKVAADEQKLFVKNPVKIFSVAPGIVDTQMQDEIRTYSKEDFHKVGSFIDYKNNNLLTSTEETAIKIIYLINNHSAFENTLLDVRDF
jgi:benzil reductase ((S)-benzoin forming)